MALRTIAALLLVGLHVPAATAEETAGGDGKEGGPVATVEPRLAARLAGPARPWVNQRMELELELVRPRGQDVPPAPRFPELSVEGAIALGPTFSPPPEEKSLEGVRLLVQRRRYLIFPQRQGEIVVPALTVDWVGEGEGSGAQPRQASSKPLRFNAAVAPGAPEGAYVVAESLELKQSFEGEPESLRVGDSLTRVVTVRAVGVDAMLLPPLLQAAEEPGGMTAYAAEPQIETRTDRGRYIAERTERVTYVVTSWGSHRLPSVELTWLKPATGHWSHASSEKVSWFAWPNLSLGWEAFGASRSLLERSLRWALLLGLLAGAIWCGRWLWRRWSGRKARRVEGPTEVQLFRALLDAARRGAPLRALGRLYRWLPVTRVSSDGLTAASLESANPQLRPRLSELNARLFEGEPEQTWDGGPLASALSDVRKKEIARSVKKDQGLLELNPGAQQNRRTRR